MSNFPFNKLSETTFIDPESVKTHEIEEHLSSLQRSHELRYQIANIETWALVNTMDSMVPGFWSRFMANRQVALREFLERKKQRF